MTPSDDRHVSIIGAGVAGLWAALELARRGFRPKLYDRVGAPGPHGCSWWAGGMLAPYCEGETAETVVVRHGLESAQRWASVTPVTHHGTLVVAPPRDQGELARFARRTTHHKTLSREELHALEPGCSLPGTSALLFEEEAHLDPRQALTDLLAQLSSHDVPITIASVAPEDLPGIVLDCRGLAAGDSLPNLRGVRGEMVILRAPHVTLHRPVRMLHPRHSIYIVPRRDHIFMLGATQIESGSRGPVTARSLLELLSAAYALDPAFGEAEVLETGSDARPAFPDNVPRVVKRTMRHGTLLHLNGLFRHGYLMAPALAKAAADYLETGERSDLFHED